MSYSGKIINADTLAPIPGAVIDIYLSGDMTGTPVESQQAGDDGTFSFASPNLDASGAVWSIEPFGYHQTTGGSGALNGTVPVYALEVTKVIQSIPWWAWVSIVVIILGIIHFKYKKLF